MITYLVDTSAYVRFGTDPAAVRRWDAEVETGALGMCEATRAEVLFGAVPARYKLTREGQHRAAGATVARVLGEVGQQDVRHPGR